MKKIPSRFVPGIAAVAVALSAGLAAVTVVQAQTPPPPRGGPGEAHPPMPPGGPMMGAPGMHGRMAREMQRLRTSLQLNAQQLALWDRAAAMMKPQGDLREQMRAHHDRMAAMLDDPNFDPRKLAAETDNLEAQHRAKMAAIRDAWFAVYDSLNPVQRGQVREFLRERMAHRMHGMQRMEERMGERMGEMHHGGDRGQAPMAPPAPGQPR